jgi:DNA transposition AAA+ family ATPase
MNEHPAHLDDPFIVTKEYRRFAEFCTACRRYRYIGLCYGLPGVGKTLSARHYAQWDALEPALQQILADGPRPQALRSCRTICYTPMITNSPNQIARAIASLQWRLTLLVEDLTLVDAAERKWSPERDYTELLIVDEADRLKMAGLEQLRDFYDRHHLGLVLIGMPGLEKRLARYPQLYSRVGFVHQFRSLSGEELQFILTQKWEQCGFRVDQTDFTDTEAMATIIRITSGNFRLLQRLFMQIERILQINQLHVITKEVVEAAREGLVIGNL